MSKPIAFYPQLASEFGDIPSAIYYQQLFYWSDKGTRKDGFVYKTVKEIEDETSLTRRQQDRIRKKLVEKGWIEVKKIMANGSPTLHYKCNKDIKLVISQCTKRTNPNVQKVQNEMYERDISITENTTENTTDNIMQSNDCDTKQKKSQDTDLGVFNYNEKLQTMMNSTDARMPIIATYWKLKGFVFENAEQYSSALKRELIAAGRLKGYPLDRITKTIEYLKKQDFKWTMETIHKFIDDLPKEKQTPRL